jgi:hypothetical protein
MVKKKKTKDMLVSDELYLMWIIYRQFGGGGGYG